jgi:hypothetical protein
MAKIDRARELAVRNPRASAAQVEAVIKLVERIRDLGVRRREYALSGPSRKFKGLPDTPRK